MINSFDFRTVEVDARHTSLTGNVLFVKDRKEFEEIIKAEQGSGALVYRAHRNKKTQLFTPFAGSGGWFVWREKGYRTKKKNARKVKRARGVPLALPIINSDTFKRWGVTN